eukprot:gene55482-35847_t
MCNVTGTDVSSLLHGPLAVDGGHPLVRWSNGSVSFDDFFFTRPLAGSYVMAVSHSVAGASFAQ